MSPNPARTLRPTRIRALVFATVAMSAFALTGCVPPLTEPEPPAPEPASPQEPVEDLGGDTECLIGRWALDVPDYRAQAEQYLLSLSIPVESFDLTGTQIVDFTDTSFGLTTALTTSAVVKGVPLTSTDESTGAADWQWEADDPTRMVLENWAWGIEPHSPEAGAPVTPPLIDPTQPLSAACAGDTLTLSGAGAPLVGRFTRMP